MLVCLSPNGEDQYRAGGPPDAIAVATMDGVVDLAAAPDGAWSVRGRRLAGRHVSALAVQDAAGALLAGTHGDGLFRLAPGAEAELVASFAGANIFTLGYGGGVLYAGTEPAYLYRSRDGGTTWEEVDALRSVAGRERWDFPAPPHVAHTKHVDVDPRTPQTIYVSIEQGALLKSEDGGRSFRPLHFQFDASYALNHDTHRVVFDARDPDRIYVPGGDGISFSPDGGATWQHLTTPEMIVGYPDALFSSPDEPGVLYCAGGGTPPNIWRATGDADAAVARSADGGRTWERLPLPRLRGNLEAMTMTAWPGGLGFVAGTTDGEVFVSVDRGASWSLAASGLAPVSKCIHHRNLLIGRGAA